MRRAAAWCLIAALALAACQRALPDRAPAARPTIVSLNPCADAILAEVTAPGQLLAVSHYSHDPSASSMPRAQALRFPATAGTVEEIVALRPDMVIGDSFTAPATRSALARLGIAFREVPAAADYAESLGQVRALAGIVGHQAKGEVLLERIERAWNTAAAPPGWRSRTAIVWQGGGLVAGDQTLVAELLARTGFRSATAARGLGQGAILPLETMLADPPEAILVSGDPRAEQDRLLRHPALNSLPQVSRAEFDPTLFYCGGPSIPRALERLGEIREASKLAGT